MSFQLPGYIKALLAATPTDHKPFIVSGSVSTNDRIIKTKRLRFESSGILTFNTLSYEAIIVYAETWDMFGKCIIRRTSMIDLNGADGEAGKDGEPLISHPNGLSGNSGTAGGPGRDGKTIKVPEVYIFARELLWEGRPATPADVQLSLLFDGYPGGDGGTGGAGGNGSDGNQGTPAEDAWYGYDCKSGPGWGGRGGNAGPGGAPGIGANGGDASPLYMLVGPMQFDAFRRTTVSLQGGRKGLMGRHGQHGVPGQGGPEGAVSRVCRPAGRHGPPGIVPPHCPYPEVAIWNGAEAKDEVVPYDFDKEIVLPNVESNASST